MMNMVKGAVTVAVVVALFRQEPAVRREGKGSVQCRVQTGVRRTRRLGCVRGVPESDI